MVNPRPNIKKDQSLLAEIRAGAQYEKFNRILETAKGRSNFEVSLKEALSLHAARDSRALTGNDRYSPKKLVDAVMKDLSTRSRLVEIRVRNDRAMSHVREATEAVRRYIITEYADDLREFGTANERQSYVDRVLKAANTYMSEGSAVLDTIDTLIKDIDQSSHSLRHAVDCLKLLENKHGSKVI